MSVHTRLSHLYRDHLWGHQDWEKHKRQSWILCYKLRLRAKNWIKEMWKQENQSPMINCYEQLRQSFLVHDSTHPLPIDSLRNRCNLFPLFKIPETLYQLVALRLRRDLLLARLQGLHKNNYLLFWAGSKEVFGNYKKSWINWKQLSGGIRKMRIKTSTAESNHPRTRILDRAHERNIKAGKDTIFMISYGVTKWWYLHENLSTLLFKICRSAIPKLRVPQLVFYSKTIKLRWWLLMMVLVSPGLVHLSNTAGKNLMHCSRIRS